MAKMGRKKIVIDLDKLKALMRLSPSLEDTSHFFDCSQDTIERAIKKNFKCTFAEFRDKNAVHTRMSLKRKMIEKALAGDNTMMIWLSKNMLGMSDKIVQKVKTEGGPTVILTLPANGSEALDDGST
jgi:hypothetical protein